MSRRDESPKYRICHHTAPHCADWWMVEKSGRGLFGREVWRAVTRTAWDASWVRQFSTEAEAFAWIEEDRKPTTHACREVPA